MTVRIALAATAVERPQTFSDFAARALEMCRAARAGGAELIAFPEYGSMMLAGLCGDAVAADPEASAAALQNYAEAFQDAFRAAAREYRLVVVAPSFPLRLPSGVFVNRAFVFGPDGAVAHQDKIVMTRFEREQWRIGAGRGVQLFEMSGLSFGVSICYDAEFPLMARALSEAGAQLILVPSCTDTRQGAERVRIGARARALENQCYVAAIPLIGVAPWSAAIDVNHGLAGVYVPPDGAFPDDGIVFEAGMDEAGLFFADIDPDAVAYVRRNGAVLNAAHWPEQPKSAARVIGLTKH